MTRPGTIQNRTPALFQFLPILVVLLTASAALGGNAKMGAHHGDAYPVAPSKLDSEDDHWWDGFGPDQAGLNSWANAMALYRGDLVIGGDFTVAGGIVTNHVARWDGSAWHAMGSGMDEKVLALMVYNDELYAGGHFNTAGGVPAFRIARWDEGAQVWSPVGSGYPGGVGSSNVYAMTVHQGKLVAGGDGVFAWDGASWSPVGSGQLMAIYALNVFAGQLIVGGDFSSVDGVPVRSIAGWDGQMWTPVGSGVEGGGGGVVLALTLYDNALIAGGDFEVAGGIPAPYVARWDGVGWSPLLDGVGGRVEGLPLYQNDLIVGGDFTMASGVPANNIARWDGQAWTALGSGLDGKPAALTVVGTDLYVTGLFSTAGGKPSANIARWRDVLPESLSVAVTGVTADDAGSPLTPGGMGTLHLTLSVAGQATPTGMQLRLTGEAVPGRFVGAFPADSTITVDIANLEIGDHTIDFPIRLRYPWAFDPTRAIPTDAAVCVIFAPSGTVPDPGSVSFPVVPLVFDPLTRPTSIVDDLRSPDCLRTLAPSVYRFAQWAVAHFGEAGGPVYDIRTRLGATQCVESACRNMAGETGEGGFYPDTGTLDRPRRTDTTNLMHYGNPDDPIGDSADFNDIVTGVLRSLGLQVRDVLGQHPLGNHAWCEVQVSPGTDPDDSSLWIPCDAARSRAALDGGSRSRIVEEVWQGSAPAVVRAGNWNLPNAYRRTPVSTEASFTNRACGADSSCWSCTETWTWSGPADAYGSQQIITSWYPASPPGPVSSHGRSEDLVSITLTAPGTAESGAPFPARMSVANEGLATIDSLRVLLQLKESVLEPTNTYSTIDPEVWIYDLEAGATVSVDWVVTALIGERRALLRGWALSAEADLLATASVPQGLNRGGTMANLFCDGGGEGPGMARRLDPLPLRVLVQDGAMGSYSQATVQARILDAPGGQLIWNVPLVWSSADTAYTGTLLVPADAEARRYHIEYRGEAPGYDVFPSEGSLTVLPNLELSLSAEPVQWTPPDTLGLTVHVMDLGAGFDGSVVAVAAATPAGSWRLPLSRTGVGEYGATTSLRRLASLIPTDEIPAGSWQIVATADAGGEIGRDSLFVSIEVSDLSVRAFSVDTLSAAFRLNCWVRNEGNAASEPCLVQLFTAAPDTLSGTPIGEPVLFSPLAPGAELQVRYIWGVQELPDSIFVVVDPPRALLEQSRSNNVFLYGVVPAAIFESPIPPGGTRLIVERVIPNPSFGQVTLDYYVPADSEVEIELYDVAGRLIRSEQVGRVAAGWRQARIDASHGPEGRLAAGLYFLKVRCGSMEAAGKYLLLH